MALPYSAEEIYKELEVCEGHFRFYPKKLLELEARHLRSIYFLRVFVSGIEYINYPPNKRPKNWMDLIPKSSLRYCTNEMTTVTVSIIREFDSNRFIVPDFICRYIWRCRCPSCEALILLIYCKNRRGKDCWSRIKYKDLTTFGYSTSTITEAFAKLEALEFIKRLGNKGDKSKWLKAFGGKISDGKLFEKFANRQEEYRKKFINKRYLKDQQGYNSVDYNDDIVYPSKNSMPVQYPF